MWTRPKSWDQVQDQYSVMGTNFILELSCNFLQLEKIQLNFYII